MTGPEPARAAAFRIRFCIGCALVATLAVGCGNETTTARDASRHEDAALEVGFRPDADIIGDAADLIADVNDAKPGAGLDAGADPSPDLRLDTSSVRDADTDSSTGRDADALVIDAGRCTGVGHITYTLAKTANPTAAEQRAYTLITTAMDKAVSYYNCYTTITKALRVTYNPGVPTADGNINGSIRFGGTAYMEYETAMHEISHTVGVGTASNWFSFVGAPDGGSSGVWKGENANAELRAITGNPAVTLKADRQHFWPYGLNYAGEVKSEADARAHCRIVAAIRKDLGL
jgi:hypothetical protein